MREIEPTHAWLRPVWEDPAAVVVAALLSQPCWAWRYWRLRGGHAPWRRGHRGSPWGRKWRCARSRGLGRRGCEGEPPWLVASWAVYLKGGRRQLAHVVHVAIEPGPSATGNFSGLCETPPGGLTLGGVGVATYVCSLGENSKQVPPHVDIGMSEVFSQPQIQAPRFLNSHVYVWKEPFSRTIGESSKWLMYWQCRSGLPAYSAACNTKLSSQSRKAGSWDWSR